MIPRILKVDFNESSKCWIVQLRLPDGRRTQAQLGPSAFQAARSCPMGQFLLHAWFSRASVMPEEQPAQQ
jgi:hypothetical protein